MMNEKWSQLLGLASRARKLTTGEELVVKEIRNKKAKLVLLAEDGSENTKKKISDKCHYYHIPFRMVSDRYHLGKAIGKSERVVVSVNDLGFATKLKALLDE
jgi:ribosomal protein L7Ae-like RNA K-turn-binding protein